MDARTLTGRTLGHHAVLEPIGEGGMGVVYKARDIRLGRLVALKVLSAHAFGDDLARRRRFALEARAASALNHPNIVTVYEIDRAEEDDVDFIAMEYIDGRTLCDAVGDAGTGVDEKLRLASEVADALVAAHAAGIVHRDLKPSNIMVAADGRAKVLDFGLARSTGARSSADDTTAALTGSGAIVGTAAYMSPEQATGRPVDARSDIFSFGCVLYEMLAGCRAFRGDSDLDVLASVLRDKPKPLPGVAPGVMQVVERCLSKDPGGRYQSAAELKTALASCRAGDQVHPASIAVLPLANLGGGPEDDYLSEGLAEAIIGALTGIVGLRVIARTSAFAVARQGLDAREIGARLGVAHVLEGSVRRAGARVRVSVRLVCAADGTDVWSERYDHESPDVFALEDTISAAVVRRLRGQVGGGRTAAARPPVDHEARQAFLEGRYHFTRGGPAGLARAKASFERALARDPGFALACDSLAEVYWFGGFFGVMPPREAFSKSTWLAMRALELDDSLAETHALLGMLRKELDYNWPEVEREMRRALDLNPASPLVRVRNAISGLLPLGRLDEAVAEVTRALEVDPLSMDVRWWLACLHWLARRPERTVEIARGMTELDPTSFWGHFALGAGLAETGALDMAVAAMARACDVSGGTALSLGYLGQFLGRAGRRGEALATLERLRQGAEGRYLPPFSVALVHIGLGDWDEAFAWMARAVDERDPIIMPILTFPFLDPVRSDPRYTALLRGMHLA